MNIIINPEYSYLESYIRELPDSFKNEGELIYKGRNELKVFEINGKKIVVKSFKISHLINKIAYSFFRPSKAKRSYLYGLEIIKRGINTPVPIAYIEEIKGGLLNRSFYISEYCEYDRIFREFTYYPESFEGKDDILLRFADFTSHLHDLGIYHKDYSPGNILFQKTEAGIDFCIIDINRVRFGKVSKERGFRNFERLWAGDKMLAIIAERYAANGGFDKKEAVEKVIKYNHKVMTPPVENEKN